MVAVFHAARTALGAAALLAHPQQDQTEGRLEGAVSWLELTSYLPWVLLGLRTAPKEVSGVLAAELVYGVAFVLPAKFLSTMEPPAADFLKKLQKVEMTATRPLSYAEAAARLPAALLQASRIYVCRGGMLLPLSPLYLGPYEVLERVDKFFGLAVGGPEEMVSIDHLKPHLGSGPFQRPYWRHAAAPLPPLLWCSSRSILQQLRGGALSRRRLVINLGVCGQ
jgi:hypothetical protein